MMTKWWFAVLLLSVTTLNTGCCYNFAVFQVTNSKSHMISNGRIADALAEAGHNVTMISLEHTVPSFAFEHTRHAKIVPLGRVADDQLNKYVKYQKQSLDKAFIEPSFLEIVKIPDHAWIRDFLDACEVAIVTNKAELLTLKNSLFDAIFVEQLFPCGSALGQYLQIPVHFQVNSSPLSNNIAEIFGVPWPTGYVPMEGDVALPDRMTFFQRVRNVYEQYRGRTVQAYDMTTDVFQKYFGAQFEHVAKWIVKHTPLILVSATEFIDFPRPLTSNVVHFGGLGINASASKPLPEDLEMIIAKGKNGIVFFSLGSNTNTAYLPRKVKNHILEAFSALPDYQFLVKFDAEDTEGASLAASYSNVHITHWVPQPTLLKDSRLKLFITHGGYNSLIEVAIAGKPVLLLPLMYDQQRNAQVVQRNGWGLAIDRVALRKTSKLVQAQIKEILKNDNFSKSAQRIQRILATRPFSPEELLVKNVEFAMANGGRFPELLPASVDLSYIVQENLDVYAAAGAIIIVAVIGAVYLLKLVLSFSLGLLKSQSSLKKNQ